jgi:hypothetical protein
MRKVGDIRRLRKKLHGRYQYQIIRTKHGVPVDATGEYEGQKQGELFIGGENDMEKPTWMEGSHRQGPFAAARVAVFTLVEPGEVFTNQDLADRMRVPRKRMKVRDKVGDYVSMARKERMVKAVGSNHENLMKYERLHSTDARAKYLAEETALKMLRADGYLWHRKIKVVTNDLDHIVEKYNNEKKVAPPKAVEPAPAPLAVEVKFHPVELGLSILEIIAQKNSELEIHALRITELTDRLSMATKEGNKHRDAFDIAELAKKEQEQKHLELEASVKRLNEKVGELNKQITGLKRDKRRVELERDQLKKKGNDLSFTLGQAATIRKLETKGKGG